MCSHAAIAHSANHAVEPLTPRERILEEFVASVEAGLTIALLLTKEPDAAVVNYFRDARRAFEAHERLGKLNAPPVVAYVTPEDGVHYPAAQLRSASTLTVQSIAWFARLVAHAVLPSRHRIRPIAKLVSGKHQDEAREVA